MSSVDDVASQVCIILFWLTLNLKAICDFLPTLVSHASPTIYIGIKNSFHFNPPPPFISHLRFKLSALHIILWVFMFGQSKQQNGGIVLISNIRLQDPKSTNR